MSFNEHVLERSIIELLQNKGYIHQTGSELLRVHRKTDIERHMHI